jgi:hypothetical protein
MATKTKVLREAERQGLIVRLDDDGIEMMTPKGKCIDYDMGHVDAHRDGWYVERDWNAPMSEFWADAMYDLSVSRGQIVDCDNPGCQ